MLVLGTSVSVAAQDTLNVVPIINDTATQTVVQDVEVFSPLREQSEPQFGSLSPLQQIPEPAPTTLPAPATQPQAPQTSSNLYHTPISSLPSIANLVEQVSPSVLNIIVTTADGETTSEGQGSGFIISQQKEVVTNYHVIDGGTNIEIEFNDGRKYPASIIGTDEETDLALLKIESRESFPHVKFHSGPKTRIGDWVVAIGNPFGIGQSTSLGVISAIGRSRVDSGSYVDYIQTDATINRGNSGLPL